MNEESVLSFMAKEQAEILLQEVTEMDKELNELRKLAWSKSPGNSTWSRYHECYKARDEILQRLRELSTLI